MISTSRITFFFAVLAGLALTNPAGATVLYRVQQEAGGTLNFDATLTEPSFITSDITVPISDFAVILNVSPFFRVEFSPLTSSGLGGGCSQYTLATPCDAVVLRNSANGLGAYYFSPGALETPGVYTASIGAFKGTLTVSDSAAIPEPASLSVLAMGLAGIGLVARTRRQRQGERRAYL